MSRDPAELLEDVLDAIQAIEAYTSRGEKQFAADAMARDAVAMRFVQIGEATKKLIESGLDLGQASPGIPWSKVTGMRDIIAHRYWRVDADVLWDTAKNAVPPLKAAIATLARKRQRG